MEIPAKFKPKENKYLLRKVAFWCILGLLVLLAISLIFIIQGSDDIDERASIRVGVCGEVKTEAVYTMLNGSDLAMLIKRAGGLTANADISKINLDLILKDDSIYHIPSRGRSISNRKGAERLLSEVVSANFGAIAERASLELGTNSVRQINVLYIGFPAVYMLINYYPDFGRVSITHLPHTTRFLSSDYRLIDIFFTLGIDPTIRMLENRLNQPIQYYLIQDRFSFIDLIDNLQGIDLNIDVPYAEAYDLKAGATRLDGFHTWEYIRFLDVRRIKLKVAPGAGMDLIRNDNFTASPEAWQLAYEQRQHRQKLFMTALRSAYASSAPIDQIEIINKAAKTFETNIKPELMISLYTDVLNTPDFSYGTLPGYYGSENEKLFFYPDLPSFELLKNQELKKFRDLATNKKQIVY